MIVSILGAGGHARSVLNLLRNNRIEVHGIYDINYNSNSYEEIQGVKVVGSNNDIPSNSTIVLAIGDNSKRKSYLQKYHSQVLHENLIHDRALFESNSKCGSQNLIFANVVLDSTAEIGNNNIVNTAAILEHEVKIGSHCHIAVGTILCGRVKIGNECFIGANTVVKDNVTINDRVVIGAGSVVVKDIHEPGIYVGNPVRRLK